MHKSWTYYFAYLAKIKNLTLKFISAEMLSCWVLSFAALNFNPKSVCRNPHSMKFINASACTCQKLSLDCLEAPGFC